LIGRFQNPESELQLETCRREGIEVNRRPTGGGAILMGPRQLGVALALPRTGAEGRPRDWMQRFSRGLSTGLAQLGIEAHFRGKNDLEVDGRKIAGLGFCRDAPRGGLFHGSLLVDLDVGLMARVLRTPFEKITRRELTTLAGRTTTVAKLVGREVALEEVRDQVAHGFGRAFGAELEAGAWTSAERSAADDLERDKYSSEAWLFERTPVRDTTGAAKLDTGSGLVEVRVAMAGRTIKSAHVRGDFFESESALADLEARLRWHSSDPHAIAVTVREWSSSRSAGALPPDALVEVIISASVSDSEPYGCFVNPHGVAGV
jgi:lipoate-protein ligase A